MACASLISGIWITKPDFLQQGAFMPSNANETNCAVTGNVLRCSVIVCTRNRAAQLEQLLRSMEKLSLPDGLCWELIVVDNGSTDQTPSVIESFQTTLPVKRVVQPVPGLSNARNAGVQAAQGAYIVWTDDDVLVQANWLSAYLEAFERHPQAVLFAGKITPVVEEPCNAWFVRHRSYFSCLCAERDMGPTEVPLDIALDRIPYGASFAVRANEQKRYTYDSELGVAPGRRMGGEETELFGRLLADGCEGWWVPDSEVLHLIPPSRQTKAYVASYFEAGGELEAYWSIRKRTKRPITYLPLQTWLKLSAAFILYVMARTVGLTSETLRFASFRHHFGAFKYWMREADRLFALRATRSKDA
jgi:glycosyltransferase involved in cell wall biosynthesis